MQDLTYTRLLQMPDEDTDFLILQEHAQQTDIQSHQYEQNSYYDLSALDE